MMIKSTLMLTALSMLAMTTSGMAFSEGHAVKERVHITAVSRSPSGGHPLTTVEHSPSTVSTISVFSPPKNILGVSTHQKTPSSWNKLSTDSGTSSNALGTGSNASAQISSGEVTSTSPGTVISTSPGTVISTSSGVV